MLGREITEGEADYALWTQRTQHYVLSTTLEKVSGETAHLVRDVSELRSLKEQPGDSTSSAAPRSWQACSTMVSSTRSG